MRSYEQVKSIFEENGCKLLDSEYKNSKTKMRYIAACGHEHEITLDNFLAGKGRVCKACRYKRQSESLKYSYEYVSGYFENEGLEVEIVQPPEDGAEALVGSGKAQFCVSFQDSMIPAIVGDSAMPLEAVAALIQHNTSGIISRKGEGMDKPKGLEGKKYATWDLPIEKATLKQVMKNDGGDFDKVQLIPSTVTDEVSALKTKSVDAIWVFYGWAGVAAEVANLQTDYFAFKDIDPVFDYYTPVVLGNTDWMKANPDATKKFLSALKRGYQYSIDNPDAAADILLKAAPELDEKLVKKSQSYLTHEYISDAPKWGYIDAKRWNAFYNWINENKLSAATIPENFGFTNDYLE